MTSLEDVADLSRRLMDTFVLPSFGATWEDLEPAVLKAVEVTKLHQLAVALVYTRSGIFPVVGVAAVKKNVVIVTLLSRKIEDSQLCLVFDYLGGGELVPGGQLFQFGDLDGVSWHHVRLPPGIHISAVTNARAHFTDPVFREFKIAVESWPEHQQDAIRVAEVVEAAKPDFLDSSVLDKLLRYGHLRLLTWDLTEKIPGRHLLDTDERLLRKIIKNPSMRELWDTIKFQREDDPTFLRLCASIQRWWQYDEFQHHPRKPLDFRFAGVGPSGRTAEQSLEDMKEYDLRATRLRTEPGAAGGRGSAGAGRRHERAPHPALFFTTRRRHEASARAREKHRLGGRRRGASRRRSRSRNRLLRRTVPY